MNKKQVYIILSYSDGKKSCNIKKHFENNWTSKEVEKKDDQGETIIVKQGIRPDLVDIPVYPRKGLVEFIKVFDKTNNDDPILTLEGQKALQLNILEQFIIGYIK